MGLIVNLSIKCLYIEFSISIVMQSAIKLCVIFLTFMAPYVYQLVFLDYEKLCML